jgi:hypothetical protein
MPDLTAREPQMRAGRAPWWDGWLRRVTSGAFAGMNGAPGKDVIRAFATIACFIALVDVVNVLTILHDVARQGRHLAAWQPIAWEFTSGVVEVPCCFIIYWALLVAPPGQLAWRKALPVHALASLMFSALHVAGMNALRMAIYAALGGRYHLAAGDFAYEYRKDVLAYLILGGLFLLLARPVPATAPPPPTYFDILDGGRTLRTPLGKIISLRAAGNYVEFLLEDGTKPLMRTSLTDMEAALAPAGFVRTHRSWLINQHHIRTLTPTGSGDFTLTLDGGTEAPLSRRFPAALARLRAAR